MTRPRSTVYVCTDQGQHRAARLGEWNDEQSEHMRRTREMGEVLGPSPHVDWEFDRHAMPQSWITRGPGGGGSTIDLTTGGFTATLRCPRCKRERRIRVERLDAALDADVRRVDVSRL